MSNKESKTKHKVVKSVKKSSPNVWMISTLTLAVLLIISIATNGFGLIKPTVSSVVSDVNSLKSKTTDTSLKSALESVATALTPYQNVVTSSNSDSTGGNYDGKKVIITEYSDFQCPFCKKAEEDAIAKIKKNFGDAVTIDYKHYPLSFHPLAQKASEASECARDQNKFWEYHKKLFEVTPALEVDKLKTYAKDLGLDTTKFNTCLDGGQKASVVQAQFNEGQQKGVSGTPAFFIDGQLISGAQPYESFLPLICKLIPNHQTCLDAPKPVNFNIYIIEDTRCTDCNSAQINGVLAQMFNGAQIQKLDYNSAKGKELYTQSGLVYLPMYVLDSKVKDDPGFSKIQGALVQKGDYYFIQPQAVGSSFDPSGEICDNKIDDNKDGLVDCKDPTCTEKVVCREAKNKTLDLFIMSDCPYGKQAVIALKETKDNFGVNLNFNIHYIANENADGTFQSLHGSYEVDEDIRQLCAKQIAPTKYFDYIYCRSVNGIKGIDYTSCANSAGIDAAVIKTCLDGSEGKALLREDIKIANALQVSASPTWYANNRYEFSGVDAETTKTNFCKYNIGTPGCENVLTTNTAIPAGAGCGS